MTSVYGEQIQDENLSESETVAISLIRDRDGIVQSELWKAMDRSSRTGSRIARSLAEKGLIDRIETTHDGQKTYELHISNPEESSRDDVTSAAKTNPEFQELSEVARTIVTTLERRGETPINRIDREVNEPPSEVDATIRELLDEEIITIERKTLYGRETDVLYLNTG